MFTDTKAFSSFSVDDLGAAKRFYGETLGIEVSEDEDMGVLTLHIAGERPILAYPKADHKPATFTILNFPVSDIDAAVAELGERGVELERYEGFDQDDAGVARTEGGPSIAWFTDPAGNVVAVIETDEL